MSVRDELQAIYNTMGGLTPPMVVAIVSESPDEFPAAHSRIFALGTEEAAYRWRVSVAHDLIQSVKIVVNEPDKPSYEVRQFLPVYAGSDRQPVYRESHDIAADPVATKVVLAQMKRQWIDMKRSYGHLVEFFDMVRDDLGEETA